MTDHPGGPTRLSEPLSFGEQTQALTNDDGVIRPVGVAEVAPQGDPETIESLAADLRTHGTTVSETGYDIKSSWGGLTNAYHAPDHQDDLYAAMDTVAEDGDDVQTGTERAASALETFAGELASIQRRFSILYEDAVDLRDRIDEDEDWRDGGFLGFGESEEVEENKTLIRRGIALLTEYAEAEVVCANAITNGVPNSTEFSSMPQGADDGDLDEDVFYHGFDGTAEELMEEWGVVGAETDHNWVVDSLAAGWDHTVDFVEGVGGFVGAHSSEGWFEMSGGDAIKEYHRDNIAELAGLVGLYDRESDSFGWAGFDSAGESWKELAHSVVPWTEWEDRPGYVVTTAVLNTLGVVGGAALTATGVGAVVGVPLMAWRGASMLDGMGSGPAAGGADGGADLDAGSGSPAGGIPAGGGGGSVPTTVDPAGFQAPEAFSPGDLPDSFSFPGESGPGGTGAGGNEGGVPRAPITPAGEASDTQRSGRGGSGPGRSDREVPEQRPAPTPVADVDVPAESTGGADRSGQDNGSGSAEGSHWRDTGPEQTGSGNRWGVNEDTGAGQETGPGSESTRSDESSETARDADTADAYGDRWGHTEQAGRADTGSESSTQPSQSPSQPPEPTRADAAETGARSTTDGTDPGNGTDHSRADGRADGADRLDGDNSRTDRMDEGRQGRNDRGDEHTDARFRETADGRHARSDEGPANHPDASEVTRAGDPRLPEHVRDDHPAVHLKEGQDLLQELEAAFQRDSARDVGSQSDAFRQFLDRENASYDQFVRDNRDTLESMRSTAEQDPGWKAQSLADTPAPRSGWEHAGRQDGDHGDGDANSGSTSDPRFDGPGRDREPATATAAAKAAAMATARLNSSGRGVDGARAERGPSGEGPRRDQRDGDRGRPQSHDRWSTERGPGRSPDMHDRGPEARNDAGPGGRGSETPESGRSGDGARDTSAHRDSDTDRTSGEGSRGGGGKPPVTPTGGPEGTDAGSGKSDSGDGRDGSESWSEGQREGRKISEERRRLQEQAQEFLRDKDLGKGVEFVKNFVKYVNSVFIDPLNTKSLLIEAFYDRSGSRMNASEVVNGEVIPQLYKEPSTGRWLAKESLPPPERPTMLTDRYKIGADLIPDSAKKKLDSLAELRHKAINKVKDLTDLGGDPKDLKGARRDQTTMSENYGEGAGREGVREFSGRKVDYYDTRKGDDGSVIRERAGELDIPKISAQEPIYPNADLYPDLPKNGNHQFDQIWEADDGSLVVVEAKSSGDTSLNERIITDENGDLKRVSQGTREYFNDILDKMIDRGGKEKELARRIIRQRNSDPSKSMVHYVEARGNPVGEKHGGVELALYDLRR